MATVRDGFSTIVSSIANCAAPSVESVVLEEIHAQDLYRLSINIDPARLPERVRERDRVYGYGEQFLDMTD